MPPATAKQRRKICSWIMQTDYLQQNVMIPQEMPLRVFIFLPGKHFLLDWGLGNLVNWICTQRSLVDCGALVHPLPSVSLYKSFSGFKGSLFNCFSSHPPTQTYIQRAQDVQKCGGWKQKGRKKGGVIF